ncbi:hypothetical protein [Cupriavidus sp. KK10]|jgi:hypothetical protein|uniref:hypothetical protein n=1 Tax=Cupriavidus sp. KK10 TaxID=1478019 RepID=UPI0020130E57|nr:hypothetical protein [Cupriavidus sp. KK10]
MTQRARDLYQSSNGDRWSLVHDLDSGRVFIRHESNMPSGGQTSEIALAISSCAMRTDQNMPSCYGLSERLSNPDDFGDRPPVEVDAAVSSQTLCKCDARGMVVRRTVFIARPCVIKPGGVCRARYRFYADMGAQGIPCQIVMIYRGKQRW